MCWQLHLKMLLNKSSPLPASLQLRLPAILWTPAEAGHLHVIANHSQYLTNATYLQCKPKRRQLQFAPTQREFSFSFTRSPSPGLKTRFQICVDLTSSSPSLAAASRAVTTPRSTDTWISMTITTHAFPQSFYPWNAICWEQKYWNKKPLRRGSVEHRPQPLQEPTEAEPLWNNLWSVAASPVDAICETDTKDGASQNMCQLLSQHNHCLQRTSLGCWH